MSSKIERVYIPEVVGQGYKAFWNWKGRYRVVKGSRASKKSKTTALWFIYNIAKYPLANLLVVRKTFRTLKDSCFAELKWAAYRLKVDHLWRFTTNPLEAEYLPTGQKIYFRGLDDPLKVTSIAVEKGVLCWLWIEEAYEINREEDFDVLNESIRGEVPEGYFKQATLTLNPWNENHWIKRRFFDYQDPEILAMTTNYKCNEWLDDADRREFERMKRQNPERYKVAGLGEWGEVSGLVLYNWKAKELSQDINDYDDVAIGQDFGYNHANAILLLGIKDGDIYIIKEIYEFEKDTNELISLAAGRIPNNIQMWCDSAEPDRIAMWKKAGYRARGVTKEKTTVLKYQATQIDWLKQRQIYVDRSCINTIKELEQWKWKKDERTGEWLDEPVPIQDDAMAALRYGVEGWRKSKGKMRSMSKSMLF